MVANEERIIDSVRPLNFGRTKKPLLPGSHEVCWDDGARLVLDCSGGIH